MASPGRSIGPKTIAARLIPRKLRMAPRRTRRVQALSKGLLSLPVLSMRYRSGRFRTAHVKPLMTESVDGSLPPAGSREVFCR